MYTCFRHSVEVIIPEKTGTSRSLDGGRKIYSPWAKTLSRPYAVPKKLISALPVVQSDIERMVKVLDEKSPLGII